MSTSSTTQDAHALAERAKKVGWKVTKPRSLGGAYRVFMGPCTTDRHCTHQVYIHLTSSDVNARRSIERAFNAHGIAGLEKKADAEQEKARQEKLEADRKANDAKAEEISKLELAVNRAAGPYAEAEYVQDSWFTDHHPAPWTRKIMMTPRQAGWLLREHNKDNRPLRKATRDYFHRLIIDGHWKYTHQGGAIDRNLQVQDGQHRLAAIEKAGVDVPMLFTAGADPANWSAIDAGLKRTVAQAITRQGFAHGGTVAAVVKLVYVYEQGQLERFKDQLSAIEEEEIVGGDRDEFAYAAAYGHRHNKSTKIAPAALGAARYILRRENGPDNPFIDAFFRGLNTRRKLDRRLALDEKDPREKLREYIDNARDRHRRISGLDQFCLVITAWNRIIENRRVEYLRLAVENRVLPVVRKIAADSPNCPILLNGEVTDIFDGDSPHVDVA